MATSGGERDHRRAWTHDRVKLGSMLGSVISSKTTLYLGCFQTFGGQCIYSRSTKTGAPQGCVLSPLLFSLYTNDCTSKDPSVKLLKFADDTTLIGLIQDGDKSAYRQEV